MHTYIIATEQQDFLKIGKATNVRARFASLKTGTPYRLDLIGYFKADIEAQLHTEFARFRHKGEWFQYSILDQIKAIPGFILNNQPARTRRVYPKRKEGKRLPSRTPVAKKKIAMLQDRARRLLTYALMTMDPDTHYVEITAEAYMEISNVKSLTTFKTALRELLAAELLKEDKQRFIYLVPLEAIPHIWRTPRRPEPFVNELPFLHPNVTTAPIHFLRAGVNALLARTASYS